MTLSSMGMSIPLACKRGREADRTERLHLATWATHGDVSHEQDVGLLMDEFANVDLPC